MSFNDTKTPVKPTCKARWQVPTRPRKVERKCKDGHIAFMYVDEYYLEGELKDRFCQLFPIHSNRRIMSWFGISFSTCQRFKRDLGLKKDMSKIRKEQAADTKKICEKNGWYDSIRGKAPSKACLDATRRLRAEGFVPMTRLKETNPRKYKRVMKKRGEARKELIRKERMRIALGLAPKTKISQHFNLSARPYTKAETHKRSLAVKKGYVLSLEPEDRYTIFYEASTDRSEKFEQNCISIGMKIEQWPDEDDVNENRPVNENENENENGFNENENENENKN